MICIHWDEKIYKILVHEPEEKRQLVRLRHQREDNIKTNVREIGLEGVVWICLAQDMNWWQVFVSTVMKLWVPQRAGNFSTN